MDEKSILNDQFVNMIFEIMIQAGHIAEEFEKNNLDILYKSPNQPVTQADLKINKFIKEFCQLKTPNFGWLSEESVDDSSRKSCDYFWCLDPIDGTRSFIQKKPEYTISLALIKKNTPIFGIVYNPKTKEFFHAMANSSAFCNKKKINVAKNDSLENLTMAISSSEKKKFDSHKFNIKKLIKIGSIAYKVALVAKGEIDATVSFTKKNDWDLAAAILILNRAGGLCTTISGKKIKFNSNDLKISSVLSSNEKLHYRLSSKLTQKF